MNTLEFHSPQRVMNRFVAALCTAIVSATHMPISAQSVTDFATQAQVNVPAGTAIARVALPPSSIAALRSADGGDLRIFNTAGVALPYSLINAAAQAQAKPDALGPRFAALPIYATESTTANTPTLRIEEGPKRRVIEYSSPSVTASKGKPEPRGLLFDTRTLETDVRAVELHGVLPAATIVKVSLDISSDLKTWRSIANDAPVFDFGNDAPSSRRVTLSGVQKLKDHYLRLTWSTPTPLAIDALQAVGFSETNAVPPISLELGAPASSTDDAAEWTLPSGFRASGLRVQTSAVNALMPLRVLTRARAGDPWRMVASTVVYRLNSTDGTTSVNPALTLNTRLDAQLRVEPQRGYRLSGVPLTLAIEYPPVHAIFVASGSGPFVVAAGKVGLETAALPTSTLIPGYTVGVEYALPVLTASTGTDALAARANVRGGMDDWFNRSTLLWGVLGLAVLILGGLAVSLLRTPAKR